MANEKRTVYVGGLDEQVTVSLLKAAFLPFGEVKAVDIPMDNQKGTNRGFGFVEFEEAEDAKEAVFNMDNSELFGRVIRVNLGRPTAGRGKAAWADEAQEWYKALQQQQGTDKATEGETEGS